MRLEDMERGLKKVIGNTKLPQLQQHALKKALMDVIRSQPNAELQKVVYQGAEAGLVRAIENPNYAGNISNQLVQASVDVPTASGGIHVHKISCGWLGNPKHVTRHNSESARRALSRGTGDAACHRGGEQFGFPPEKNLDLGHMEMNSKQFLPQVENPWRAILVRGGAVFAVVKAVYAKTPGSRKPAGPPNLKGAQAAEYGELRPVSVAAQDVAVQGGKIITSGHSARYGNFSSPARREADVLKKLARLQKTAAKARKAAAASQSGRAPQTNLDAVHAQSGKLRDAIKQVGGVKPAVQLIHEKRAADLFQKFTGLRKTVNKALQAKAASPSGTVPKKNLSAVHTKSRQLAKAISLVGLKPAAEMIRRKRAADLLRKFASLRKTVKKALQAKAASPSGTVPKKNLSAVHTKSRQLAKAIALVGQKPATELIRGGAQPVPQNAVANPTAGGGTAPTNAVKGPPPTAKPTTAGVQPPTTTASAGKSPGGQIFLGLSQSAKPKGSPAHVAALRATLAKCPIKRYLGNTTRGSMSIGKVGAAIVKAIRRLIPI